MAMRNVSFRLPQYIFDEFKELAKERKMTQTALLTEAIQASLGYDRDIKNQQSAIEKRVSAQMICSGKIEKTLSFIVAQICFLAARQKESSPDPGVKTELAVETEAFKELGDAVQNLRIFGLDATHLEELIRRLK